jgi:hypothetical protein
MNRLHNRLKFAAIAAAGVFAMAAHADTVEIGGVNWTYAEKNDTDKTIALGSGTYKVAAIPTSTVLNASDFPWTVDFDGETYTVVKLKGSALYGCENLTGVITVPDKAATINSWAIAYCRGLTHAVFGRGVKSIEGKAFQGCSGLLGVLIPGPQTVTKGTQTYTEVSANDTFTDAVALKIVLLGPNTKGTDFISGENTTSLMRHVKDSKVYVPDNGYWDSLKLGGTNNKIVKYGQGQAFDLAFDHDVKTMIATPTTEQGLADVLNLAAVVKREFGLNTKVSITNAIEATSGLVTAEMLSNATFDAIMFTVNTQAQLDNVLKAVPKSTQLGLVIDPTDDKKEPLTLPADREVWVHLAGNGKYIPKVNGLIISFH